MKRRERRLWDENRKRILFEYVQFSYYGRAVGISFPKFSHSLSYFLRNLVFQSSILIYELSWQIHRDTIDLLWWGIVGVVEQFVLGKVEILQYLNEVEKISAHVGRLCPNIQDTSDTASQSSTSLSTTSTALRISCEKEYPLLKYRKFCNNWQFILKLISLAIH